MAINVSALEGKERSEGFLRKATDESRWSYTYDVLKNNFLKILVINILALVFAIPAVVVVVFRDAYLAGLGTIYPFNTALLHPFVADNRGLAELVTLSVDLRFYSLLIAAGLIASIGLSGAAYSIRKILQTGDEFSAKSFFHGVRVCYFNTVLPVTLFLAFFLLTQVTGDWRSYELALGNPIDGATTAYVFAIIANVLVGIYSAWLLAVGTSYKVGPIKLFKNSFILMIGTPLQTVFMAGFSLIPVWLYLIGGLLRYISYFAFILIGFSFALLCWLSFTQWVFDKCFPDAAKPVSQSQKAQKSVKQIAAETEVTAQDTARELLAAGKSTLIGRPMLPVADENKISRSATTFSRADIAGANKARSELADEIKKYESEHINDSGYREYNEMFADREKALQSPEKGKNKKRVSSENLLK